MMLTKILTRVTTVAASSAGATAVLETNQSTNEVQVPTQPTTVFAPYNDEFVFVDHHNNYSGSFLRSNANSNMMMDNNISPLNIGVTGSEFNCALTALKEHPDLIYDLMPSNLLSSEQTEKLCSAMHDVLSNHRVVSSVKAKLLKYDPHSLSSMIGNNDMNTHNHRHLDHDNVKGSDDDDDDLTNTHSEFSSTYAFNQYATGTNHLSPSEQWNQLVSDHPCAICQDVLAKPTILSCSHSFCGICLHDLITSCSEVSSTPHDIDEMISNMTVVKKCPTCNEEICRAGTYERTLDDAITVRASAIPSCEGKTQWMERRAAHNVPSRRRHKLMTSSTASGGGRADDDRDGGGDAWDLAWVLGPLTIVIIILIAIFRK